MHDISDGTALKSAQVNPEHFDILVERYQKSFQRVSARILFDDWAEAEDVTQETFFKLYRNAGMYEPHEGIAFKSWAFKILVNNAYSRLRKLQNWRKYAEWNDDGEQTPLDYDHSGIAIEQARHSWQDFMARAEARQIISLVLPKIPYRMRCILVWHYLEGMSYKQIQDLTGQTMPAIKMQLFRARQCAGDVLKDVMKYGTIDIGQDHKAPLQEDQPREETYQASEDSGHALMIRHSLVEDIIRATAAAYGIEEDRLLHCPARDRLGTWTRRIAAFLAWQDIGWPFDRLQEALSWNNISGARHSCEMMDTLVRTDAAVGDIIRKIRETYQNLK